MTLSGTPQLAGPHGHSAPTSRSAPSSDVKLSRTLRLRPAWAKIPTPLRGGGWLRAIGADHVHTFERQGQAEFVPIEGSPMRDTLDPTSVGFI
jgi:hypothetical protein